MSDQLFAWLEANDARMPDINPHFDEELYEQQRQRIKQVDKPELERAAAAVLQPDFVGTDGTWWGAVPSHTPSESVANE